MTWKPQYIAATDLADWIGVDPSDPNLAVVIEAASRAVDHAANRQFGSTTATLEFMPVFHKGRWFAETEDLQSVTGVALVHNDGTVIQDITDYILTPRNAALNNRPYTWVEWRGMGSPSYWYEYGWGYYPHPAQHPVQVTGQFGWAAVPQPIQLATRIQAGRFYERQTTVMPLNSQRIDDVSYSFTQNLDPDIETSIAPFRRQWGAV